MRTLNHMASDYSSDEAAIFGVLDGVEAGLLGGAGRAVRSSTFLDPLELLPLPIKWSRMFMGMGKIMVELCSAAMLLSVWR